VPERFVALVRDQRAATLGLLNARSIDDWALPTACTGWSVKDVVSHMVENELLLGRLYRGELTELTEADLDQQAGVERWRRADGETIRFSLWHHGSATQRVIDSRPEESWRRTLPVTGRPVELRYLLRQHFFELAVHAHDTASALGAPAPWGDRTGPIVEFCVRSAPHALARAGVEARHMIGVRVPEVGAWTLEPDGEAWRVIPGEPATGPGWTADAETLVLATTGRLDEEEALSRSNVAGDRETVLRLVAGWRVTG
jgi:uncharacterized protein (TIGR03083 family)